MVHPEAEVNRETCMACGGRLRRLGQRGGGTYVSCRQCGSLQLSPIPTEDELNRLYRQEYSSKGHYYTDPEQHRRHRDRVCRYVARLVTSLHSRRDPRLVVELGPGWGNLGCALRDMGVPYLGLEPSEEMSAYALRKGLRIISGGLDAFKTEEPIRTFVIMAVYEHLPNQTEVLQRMAALLPDDGAIVIQCPTAGFPRIVGHILRRLAPHRDLPSVFGSLAPPWHVCLPSPAGVRIQAKQYGLVVESVRPSPSGRAGGWRSLLQASNEIVANAGHRIFGENWPLSMAHVFVLRPSPPP